MGLWQCRDCGRILAQTGSTFAKATPYKAGVSTRYRCHSFRHLEMSLRSGSGGGRARSLRRSAASDRRPQRGRVQPLPVFTETASAHSARRETG